MQSITSQTENPKMILTKKERGATKRFWPAGVTNGRLWAYVIGTCIGLNALLTAVSMVLLKFNMLPPRQVTSSLSSLFFYFFRGKQGKDSWVPMMDALNVFYEHHPIYKTVFFVDKVKFQYPPSSLVPFHALRAWGLTADTIFVAMNVMTWLSVWVTIAFSFLIVVECLRRRGVSLKTGQRVNLAALTVITGLSFYPIVKGYSLGQVQTTLTALFTIAAFTWLRKRETTSGLLIGIMCLLKPQYLLINVWFLLRKKWGALAASAVVNIAGFVAACVVFGWREQVDYLSVLSFMSKHGETYFANQSVNGLLHRLLFQGDNAIFQNHTFAPYSPFVYAATLLSSLLYVAAALYFRKPSREGETEEFLRIALVGTMASPIVWEHHYGVAFAVFAYLFGTVTKLSDLKWIAVAFTLLGTSWTPMSAFAAVPVLNALQSLSFLGAILLLGFLFRVEIREATARIPALFPGKAHNVNEETTPQYG
jgi:alpha-1,2-mannosyltransferase